MSKRIEQLPAANTRDEVLVIAFESTHAALASEKALADMGAKLIPTPRAITASCGMSLRLAVDKADEARARLAALSDIHDLYTCYLGQGATYRKL